MMANWGGLKASQHDLEMNQDLEFNPELTLAAKPTPTIGATVASIKNEDSNGAGE